MKSRIRIVSNLLHWFLVHTVCRLCSVYDAAPHSYLDAGVAVLVSNAGASGLFKAAPDPLDAQLGYLVEQLTFLLKGSHIFL